MVIQSLFSNEKPLFYYELFVGKFFLKILINSKFIRVFSELLVKLYVLTIGTNY